MHSKCNKNRSWALVNNLHRGIGGLQVASLKARAEEGWPALNELVSSLLDALQPAAAAADLPALGETGALQMLHTLDHFSINQH